MERVNATWNGGASSSLVFRWCFPSLFPYSAFAPGNDKRDVMHGCLRCTTTWSGRGYSLLSATFTGDPGDDVTSPRNDKKQSSQFQYLASCASNSPHLVILARNYPRGAADVSLQPSDTDMSLVNDGRAAYPAGNRPSYHVPRISSDPQRVGEHPTDRGDALVALWVYKSLASSEVGFMDGESAIGILRSWVENLE